MRNGNINWKIDIFCVGVLRKYGSRKQTSRTKVYPEAGEKRFDFRANPYGRILQPV